MTEELFKKASSLWGTITGKRGYITRLHNQLYQTKCVIRKAEIEDKIKEQVALLDNLKKEFKQLS